eukprot:379534-Pelagomonas_calceolata.AAC.2
MQSIGSSFCACSKPNTLKGPQARGTMQLIRSSMCACSKPNALKGPQAWGADRGAIAAAHARGRKVCQHLKGMTYTLYTLFLGVCGTCCT